jgi:low temperature requirement protein LtrA
MPSPTVDRFKQWFWRPPRPHGEIIADRAVSSLELFYDLVYVAVIAQAASHLAEHVSGRGLLEFATVFALLLVAILSVLWFVAVGSFLRADAWGQVGSRPD